MAEAAEKAACPRPLERRDASGAHLRGANERLRATRIQGRPRSLFGSPFGTTLPWLPAIHRTQLSR